MDPFEVLGVRNNATRSEIEAAYRARAKKYHPDVGGDTWAFRQIDEAYQTLLGWLSGQPYVADEPADENRSGPPQAEPQNEHDVGQECSNGSEDRSEAPRKPTSGNARHKAGASKCPACGVPIDAEAYRCPTCRIYFCFNCRKRVPADAEQYQCVNRQCEYHGKLLCDGCIVVLPRMEMVYPASDLLAALAKLLFYAAFFGALALWFFFGFLYGLVPIIAFVIIMSGIAPFMGETRGVRQETGRSLCCIACKQPVEPQPDPVVIWEREQAEK